MRVHKHEHYKVNLSILLKSDCRGGLATFAAIAANLDYGRVRRLRTTGHGLEDGQAGTAHRLVEYKAH